MTARATRRQVFALIALQADLPAPRTVAFVEDGKAGTCGRIDISLDRVADLHAWLPYFDMTAKAVFTQPYTHKEEPHRGQTTTLANAYNDGDWRGWRMHLDALDPVGEPEPPLDDATREQLAAIAAAPVREDLGATLATIVPDLPIVTAAIIGAALTEADYTITKAGEAR